MAEKAKQIEKKSRIREFIEKDYKYENLLLAVLSIFALELGVLLLAKYLVIPETAFLIGGAVASKVFSWIFFFFPVFIILCQPACHVLGKTALARDEVVKENIRGTAAFPSLIRPPMLFVPSS